MYVALPPRSPVPRGPPSPGARALGFRGRASAGWQLDSLADRVGAGCFGRTLPLAFRSARSPRPNRTSKACPWGTVLPVILLGRQLVPFQTSPYSRTCGLSPSPCGCGLAPSSRTCPASVGLGASPPRRVASCLWFTQGLHAGERGCPFWTPSWMPTRGSSLDPEASGAGFGAWNADCRQRSAQLCSVHMTFDPRAPATGRAARPPGVCVRRAAVLIPGRITESSRAP